MLKKVCLRIAVGVALLTFVSGVTMAQEQAQAQGPQWKDRAEYDLYEAATKATDANEQLKTLDAWKQKYPETDYELQRLALFIQAYQKTNQPAKMYEAAEQLVAMGRQKIGTQPYFQGLYYLTTLTMSMARTEPQYLDKGDKYARELLDTMKLLEKPGNVSDADWKKQLTDLEVLSRTAIGWIAMTRKNNPAAEREFRRLLDINPQNGQVTYWLASVIIAQRSQDVARQFQAMFYFARASNITGADALPAQQRKEVADYLKTAYVKYHGDEEGLDQFINLAKANTKPPADLSIESAEQKRVRLDNEFMKRDPTGYLWMNLKRSLTADDGEQYFTDQVKGKALDLRGRVLGVSPSGRPDTVTVAITDGASEREATLKLDEPFRYDAGRGTLLHFKGVAVAFSKSPFNVTFEVEQANLRGWPPPPSRQTTRQE